MTRLGLRGWLQLPGFFRANRPIHLQAQAAPGFLGGSVAVDRGLVFWTLTAWEDPASMKAFVTSGAHLRAMPLLATMCKEAATSYWEEEGNTLPS